MDRATATMRRGKLEQLEHDTRLASAARQPHRAISGGENCLDVRLESPLGRLNFIGKITKGEYEAGLRYRESFFRHLHQIGAPYPFAQCADADNTVSGIMIMPTEEIGKTWEREFRAADGVMARMPRAKNAVRRIAAYDDEPRSELEVECLRVGLADLAEHYMRTVPNPSKVIPFSRFQATGII